ncbi:hypothetical protein IAU60_003446 [Kwoniella sp. DSM 27419]
MPFRSGPRKAEKDERGDPMYPCLWIGCNKTFGTAGHVRRHEKTHVGNTPYACPYCDKTFGRSDVRAKHVATMHGEVKTEGTGEEGTIEFAENDEEDVPRYAPRGHYAVHRSLTRRSGHRKARRGSINDAPGTVSRRFSSSSDNPFTPFIPPGTLPGASSTTIPSTDPDVVASFDHLWSSSLTQHPAENSVHGLTPLSVGTMTSPNVSIGGPVGIMMPPSITTSTPFSVPSVSSSSSGFIDPAQLNVGPSTAPMSTDMLGMDGTHAVDSLFSFDPSWEWYGHVFGWGSDENIDLDIGLQSSMFEKGGIGPVSSTDTLSAAWLLCATPRGGSPTGEKGDKGEEGIKRMVDPFGRWGDDNPWPNVFRPKAPDRPLTLAGVKASPRPHRPPDAFDAVSETSRNAMLSLIYLSHQAQWLMPDVDDFPDRETLSDFVDLYFEKFHPLLPIIHKPSFFEQETPPVLLLSVAAMGATYADKEFRPLAVALCELVRRMITWMRGSDQRSKFDRNVLLAFALQTALGIACGSREMYYHAEIFRCSIATTCRRLSLLRGIGSAMDDLYAKDPEPTDVQRYKAYLEDETKRRLGWGIYHLDALQSTLLHIPPILSVREAATFLPSEEVLWEAKDPSTWAALIREGKAAEPREPRPKFLTVLSKSLAGQAVGFELSDFASSIVSLTTHRMLMDQQALQRAQGIGLTENGHDQPLYIYSPHILESSPAQLLRRSAQTTYLSSSPSHLRLTAAALYHSANLQFLRPGLLERTRQVSGRFEPDMTSEGSLAWLKSWMKNQQEVRKVLWHAGVLNALLAEFPRGSFAELFWTFDCALIIWAVVKYAPQQISSSSTGLRSALFAANWFDTTPPDMWLAHGGEIVFPFLGSSSSWTVLSLLQLFMDRLETMPWGLAGQYRLVLNNLLQVEKGDGRIVVNDGGRPNRRYGEGKMSYD